MNRLRRNMPGSGERAGVLRFRFDGRDYTGHEGDTLAAALLANGVHLVGRSFKYHRPRGILGYGSEEPNALVTVIRDEARRTPNLRATQVELYDGLVAESQNRWPALGFDLGALNSLLAPLFPAGFYNKTFMWPRGAWYRLYEPLIRRAAGLGVAPALPDPDRYARRFAHCDVLVVGAGPAGLAAALAAQATGARVIVCDEQPAPGGSLLDSPDANIDGQPAREWLGATLDTLERAPNVRVLARTTAFGYFPHNFLGLAERVTDHLAVVPVGQPRERLWQVRAREVVLACGAIERPLVFARNDLPGVMLAGAARSYANRHGVLVGTRAVLLGCCDSAYAAALDLSRAGIAIERIVELRAPGHAPGPAEQAARKAGLPVTAASAVIRARGRQRVCGVDIATGSGRERIACDVLLMAGGYTPSVHLHSQARGKLDFDTALGAYVPGAPGERSRATGALRGVQGLAALLDDGAAAGSAAAAACGLVPHARPAYRAAALDAHIAAGTSTVVPPGEPPAKAFVDFQNDVTLADLALARREGFRSIEHIKRYTTTGMATDQGKTSNLNALSWLAGQAGESVPAIGLTTFRMPYTPTTFGAFAGEARGELFDPVRRTPSHAWASASGAVFEDVGAWKRARFFPQPGEDMHAAVARECRAVRSALGMFDASTLGKIEVVGPDAGTFLNRMYVNDLSTLAVGRARYCIQLRDDGFVYDDGIVGRIAADRFHVTTTTGGAARVFAMMEDYLQTEWPDLRAWITSTTEQWAVIALQGPRAKELLAELVEDIDLAALGHLGLAHGRVCGVPLRLFRVSFTGETGYELNVPGEHGEAIWEAVHAAGQKFGITPYGTETMHVLRAEKGYIIVGQDTDGTMTAAEAGLGWAIGRNKGDFVGKRGMQRPALNAPGRKQLVGLLTRDPQCVLEEGAQLTLAPPAQAPYPMIGHVTSSYHSATLGRSIALAAVADGRSRIGSTLYVPLPGHTIEAEVVAPVFYDPKGERLHG